MQQIFECEQSCHLFPALFEDAAASMAVALIDGSLLKVNQAFCDFLGYSEAELLQLKVLDFTHPDDRDITEARFREAGERKRRTFHYEKRYRTKSGKVVWGLVSVSWVSEGPAPPCCVALIQDITARKESESALRESEELYRTLVENIDLGINLIGEDRRILKVNAASSRMFSKPAESFVGLECFREFEKRDVVCAHCPGTLSMASGKPASVETKGVRDDGTRFVARLRTFPVPDEDGRARKFVEVVEDITAQRKVRADLQESENRFRAFFQNASVGMNIITPQGRFLQVNRAFCRFLGYSEGELLGLNVQEVTHPNDLDLTRRAIAKSLAGPPFRLEYEKRFRPKDGSTRWGLVSHVWQLDGTGVPSYAVGLVQDITERKQAEHDLAAERAFLQSVIDGVVDPIMVIGLDHKVLMMNRAAKPHMPEAWEKPSISCFELSHHADTPCQGADHPCPLEQVGRTGQAVTVVHEHLLGDGQKRSFEIQASPFRNGAGEILGIIEVSRDITERLLVEDRLRQNQKHLEFLAYHDALTGLPNRLLFQEHLTKSMAAARRAGKKVAVLILDLDRFKNINDSLGHQVGDKVLCEVANRLKYWIRQSDTLARLGGDEFGIILNQIDDFNRVAAVAKKLLPLLPQPIHVETHELAVTGSLGISVFPADAEEEENLLKFADAAMYRAKEGGRNNFRFYTPDMNARTHEFLLMETALRKALEKEQFLLHFQPQIDLETEAIVGVEALVRWHHPTLGLVSPADFIPLAEETGLIVPIGEWVLETACRRARLWQDHGLPPILMAVNISGRQFREPDFVAKVERILQESGLDPRFLELEITESVVMENVEKAIMTLVALQARGISFSIDDFGTGYSSLSYLKQFPIHSLKIDRTFVRDITSDPNDAAIATAVIALAHSMGLKVVGEGIETEEQLRILKEKGCDLGQGYLFSRPLPAEEIVREILRWQKKARPKMVDTMLPCETMAS